MPRAQNGKHMNTAQHGCSARCGLCPGGVGPDLMKATLHGGFRGKPGSMSGVDAVSTCGGKKICRLLSMKATDRIKNIEGKEAQKDEDHEVFPGAAWDDLTGAELDARK